MRKPKLLCYQCGKKLIETDREDSKESLNIHYSCKEHGLQVTVSTSKRVYMRCGSYISNESR